MTNTSTNIPPGSLVGWNFPGCGTATSTAASPTNICYATAGSYWITLGYSDMSLNFIDSAGVAVTVNVCAGPQPSAQFSASSTNLCVGDCINFTDASTSSAAGGITTF